MVKINAPLCYVFHNIKLANNEEVPDMWITIIPAQNEGDSIEKVLQSLYPCNFHCIILVANGCSDFTEKKALAAAGKNKLEILSFPEPLGIDVPRAIGAAYAKKYHPRGLVFVDGDMTGEITSPIREILKGLERGLDLALTNCYPYFYRCSDLAESVKKYRKAVNKKLNLYKKIGLATPSHGPHAISAHLLSQIPHEVLAIPPLVLAFAAVNNFKIDVATTVPHELLGSKIRSTEHADNIAATIIGDCKQALAYLAGTPLPDVLAYPENLSGYRKQRRFDLLQDFLNTLPSIKQPPRY